MAVPVKLKSRLRTVKNLNSIFEALEVITAARIQKVREKHGGAGRYLALTDKMAANIDLSRLFTKRPESRSLAVVFSANRGFTGAFDQNLFFRIKNFLKESPDKIEFMVFGKRGLDFLRAERQMVRGSSTREDLDYKYFAGLGEEIARRYDEREIDIAYIIHNRFRSVMRQDAVVDQVTPLEVRPSPAFDNIILEPGRDEVAAGAFRQLLAARLYFSYLDSELGEISARMFTLNGAIENSKEMIESLTLELNKERQQGITRELLEIISSSESIKEARE
jgi:F-type H+-transporting ATPase subunit gamma